MIENRKAGFVIFNMIKTIQDNKDFLSEVDGKIGDGDHGINMNKGFTLCEKKLVGREFSLSEGLMVLSDTLQEDIGGSMGPLYGIFFEEMSYAVKEEIDKNVFGEMMHRAVEGIQEVGSAKRGDKTLLDTLIPAMETYDLAIDQNKTFQEALMDMKQAAYKGWQETEGMVAKIGRASRLGERSRGFLDAGATSCYFLLESMIQSFLKLL